MPAKKGLSQEWLKIIACVTMLLDHIGAIFVNDLFYAAVEAGSGAGTLLQLEELLRSVGRLAYPIYCFLLAEGAVHTRDSRRYTLRLLFTAVLSEAPFDLAFYGEFTWRHQNVMVTLLLGFLMLEAMKRCPRIFVKLLLIVPFAYAAELLNTDYGADGILVIALFALTRELPRRWIWQVLGLWCIFSPFHLMIVNWIGGISITTQELAALAVVPISFYDGRKATNKKAVQWAFYLFYPTHLLVLYLIRRF